MTELDIYRPIVLTNADHERHRLLLTQAFPVLQATATERYSFPNVKKLRQDFKHDPSCLWCNPRGAAHLRRVMGVEEEMVRGHIRLGAKLSQSYHALNQPNIPGVTLDDFIQQCAMALYDSIYMYNGSTNFSTYATWAIRNRLLDFIQAEKAAAQAERRAALDPHAATHDAEVNDPGPVMRAFEDAPLSEMQRRLVVAHMRGDKEFRRIVSTTEINPATGRPWTRARLSALYVEACEIIRRVYNAADRRRAA